MAQLNRARSGLALLLALVAFASPAFAAGTLADYRLLVLDGTKVKWGASSLGSGAVVTYAVSPTSRTFTGARNCPGIAPVDAFLAANYIQRRDFDRELAAALAAWSAVANVTFRADDPASADILIGAEADPRGRAFTNVVHGAVPDRAGAAPIEQAVICLNPAERWKIGFDGNLDVYDLRYTLMHELGHAIGLDHPAGFADVMGFRYLELFRTLQPGDIGGAVALYGPAQSAGALVASAPEPPAGQPGRARPTLAIGAPAN